MKYFITKWCVIKAHASSKSHIKNLKPNSFGRSLVKSKEGMEKFVGVKNPQDKRIVEAKVSLFIAEHCSVLTVDHLTGLIQSICSEKIQAKHIQLKRTKCTAIIVNVWEPYFFKELINDIADSPFSLLLDESTDISTHKMLGIAIRYFSEARKEIISTFFAMVELNDGTAESIAGAVNDIVLKSKLSVSNCKGIGTDNASVMVGVNNGVHRKLENLWGKKLILMRCVCHSLQLAVSTACEELPKQLDFLIKETYNWFSHSTIRQIDYQDLYKNIYDGIPLKILSLSDTRWLSRYSAVARILSQWDTLKEHFRLARQKEKCYMANHLFLMYSDEINHCYLLYLRNVLEDVDTTNRLFESNNNPLKLLDDLLCLVEKVGKHVIQPNLKHRVNIFDTADLTSYLEENPSLGYSCETKLDLFLKKNPDEKSEAAIKVADVRIRCKAFALKLIQELKNRVPDNYKILRLMRELSMEKTLRQVKPKITDLINLPV